MKTRPPHHHLPLAALTLGLILALPVQAALHNRGGGLIYDDVLNITWLQNANYGADSSYDNGSNLTDGLMTWANAVAWADTLVYHDSVRNVDYSDWRLPGVSPINGTAFNYNFGVVGTTDVGYNVSAPSTTYAFAGHTGSELAYMYYNNMDNKGLFDPSGHLQTGYGLVDASYDPNDESLFSNLQNDIYWSGLEYALFSDDAAWIFGTIDGYQGANGKWGEAYAWAVRPGDVAATPIPEAESFALMALGMGLVGWLARRRR
jgi:hypothetical protein